MLNPLEIYVYSVYNSVTNNLIHNIAMIPDIVLKFLTFDTDGQHSTWRYDKRDDYSFTITHFPQNSIIPTAAYGV
jgi:hypothetical protein